MGDLTESEASAARDGDSSAFSKLYDRIAPALYSWACLRIREPMQRHISPEDLVQEVWWRALDGFTRFDPEKTQFRPWIFKIANNVFFEAVRRRPESRAAAGSFGGEAKIGDVPDDLQAEVTSVTQAFRRDESVKALAEEFAKLPEDELQLVIYCGLEGLSHADVAALIEASPEAVKKRWQRLRARLSQQPVWAGFIDDASP